MIAFVLMRHATASPLGRSDRDRELTPLGRTEATEQSQWLVKNMDSSTIIVHSPYARAIQTASIVATTMKADCIQDDRLGADRRESDVIDVLSDFHGRPAIVITHQPMIAEVLASLLQSSAGHFHMPPATFACCAWDSFLRKRAVLLAYSAPEAALGTRPSR